jgi:hypothetical protein
MRSRVGRGRESIGRHALRHDSMCTDPPVKRIAGLVAFVLLLAACGGGGTKEKGAAATSTLANSAPGTRSSAAPSVSIKGVPIPKLTKPLADQVLEVEQLPSGWSVGNSDDSAATPATGCFTGETEKQSTTATIETKFRKGDGLPIFDESLGSYGHSDAQSSYHDGIARLDGCKDVLEV